MDNSILDNLDAIFSDPLFNEMVAEIPVKKVLSHDPEIEKFQEITDWIKAHEGKEPEKSRDMTERRLYSRLKGYRLKPEMICKLSSIDELKLLQADEIQEEVTKPEIKSLDDILNDSLLFEDDDKSKKLLDLSRYKRTINNVDKRSQRKKASHFERYDLLFKKVHEEIASGQRQLKSFSKEANAGEGNNIKVGNFYVDNGVLLTVLRIFDENGQEYTESRNRDLKIHTVYENGTENKAMTLLGFVSNLYDTKRHGRLVTELVTDTALELSIDEPSMNDMTTGYIYVLKTLSTNPELQKYKNLYKIGFSSGSVEQRIANAENEATYLYAPVQIIATWEIQNFSARKLETALHHHFESQRVEINIPSVNGKIEKPSEWFIVDVECIKTTINKIILDIQF